VNLSNQDLKELHLGIVQFNEQRFFECHETLEKVWFKQQDPEKELLQGLIQLAVAYHHMLKGNQKGALRLLNRGLPRVRKYEPQALGLGLSDLCRTVESNVEQLQFHPDRQIAQASIPRVRLL
jgi:hypothetical protein